MSWITNDWLAAEDKRAETYERGAHGRKIATIIECLYLAGHCRRDGMKVTARTLINCAKHIRLTA